MNQIDDGGNYMHNITEKWPYLTAGATPWLLSTFTHSPAFG
jgi:hypothetical protein